MYPVNFSEDPSEATQYQILDQFWHFFDPRTRTRIFGMYKFCTQTKYNMTVHLRKSKYINQWTQHGQKCEKPYFWAILGPFSQFSGK